MSDLQIELPILDTIKDAQMQHGLKYENYRNYHSYCSRKLRRIRRSLNVAQGVAPSAKARHQRARKLMDVSNELILEAGQLNQEYAERVLVIPLFLAERAWSHAMQLKQDVTDQPRKRFHLVRRLEKAAKYATKFEQLCQESPCLEKTKREATAYSCYINGLYKLERENWNEAKQDLNKALTIYFTLSSSVNEHYRQRIEELRASLKYCAFNLGEKDNNTKVKLQFHDIAFKHAKQEYQAEEDEKDKEFKEVKEDVEYEEDDEDKEFKDVKEDETNEEDEDNEDDDEEEDEEESDDDEQQQTQPGGVTKFLKGWLY